MGSGLMDVDRALTRAARGVLRLLGLLCALVGFVLSVVGAVLAHFVPFLLAKPPRLAAERPRRRRSSSIHASPTPTHMPGTMPKTTRRHPKRPTNSRHVSFPPELPQQGKHVNATSGVAGSARTPLGRSSTLSTVPSRSSPMLSPRSRERLLMTLPVLQEDSNESRISPVSEFGALREPPLVIPDVGPLDRTPSLSPPSPVASVSSGTTDSSAAGPLSETSEVEKAPCCKRAGIKHCPMHRHRHSKPSPSAPVLRTQPYAAPYFFPFPDSPESLDYVQRVREERRRTAYSASSFDASPRPKTSAHSRSPKEALSALPQTSPDPAYSPNVLPPATALLRQPALDEETTVLAPIPLDGMKRRHSWLHPLPRSRPTTPQGEGEEKQKRRHSWRPTHSRTPSLEEAPAPENRVPAATSASRSFFRRSHKA